MKKNSNTFTDITTFEKACEKLKMATTLPDVSGWPEKHRKYAIADFKLVIIAEAINTDDKGILWEPDYNDESTFKYEPYFGIKASKDKPAGFGFSYSTYVDWFSITYVGSRLCFDSREKVAHIQKHFEELFLERTLLLK